MTDLAPLLLLAPAGSRGGPGSRHTVISGETQPALIRLWESLGTGPRAALIGIAALGLLALVYWIFRQLGRGRWRRLVGGFTVLSGIAFTGFALWAMRLPTPKGTYFVLWHQGV